MTRTRVDEPQAADEAIRASERQMRALVDSLDALVFELDAQGACLNLWAADEDLPREPRAQLLERHLLGLVASDGGGEYVAIVQRILASGRPEIREYSSDIAGAQRWFVARVSPVLSGSGAPRTVSVLIRDITEQKRAEQASLRYREQLATVVAVEHALAASLDQDSIYGILADGIQRLFPDMDTIFISRFDAESELITAVYGFNDGEPVDVSDLPAIRLLPPGEGTQSQVIRTRQPLIIGTNFDAHLGSGPVVWVGSGGPYTQSAAYVPMVAQDTVLGVMQLQSCEPNRLTEADARVLALIANTAAVSIQNARLYALAQREIAERTQAEATLRESERHLKAAQQELLELNRTLEERVRQRTAEVQDLYERAPVGYHSVDAHGTMMMVNQTELTLLGYARAEMLGRPVTDFLTPPSRATFHATFPVFRQRGWLSDLEAEFIRSDGTTLPVLISATAIYDQAGAYVMSRSTVIDMTLRKQVEETMRRANVELARAARAKDDFLANMSHELRTPLNAILAFSEILREAIYGPLNPRQQDSLHNIETSGHHLLELINDILDLSKVESGQMNLQVERVSVADLCDASLLFVRELALKKSLRIAFDINDSTATLEVDPRRMKQMLVNLLSNAVKFTPTGGYVRLEVAADAMEGVIRFAVQDTGIGIAPDDLARLFQPFSQLDSSLSRQYEGTGLGLALVRRLAEQHGGSIAVESALGAGSRFTITLPYQYVPKPQELQPVAVGALGAAPAPAALANAPLSEPSPPQARILLAEDSEINILAIEEYLQAKGYQVIVAHNGREALDLADRVRPDLILMDIQMPDLDGLEAIRRLRARPTRATIPIVALTALAMPGDRERCLAVGANAYLAKPVSLKGLLALIERLLH
ncbi:MAG: ATP-binding protein [Chloroflexales bacterium]